MREPRGRETHEECRRPCGPRLGLAGRGGSLGDWHRLCPAIIKAILVDTHLGGYPGAQIVSQFDHGDPPPPQTVSTKMAYPPRNSAFFISPPRGGRPEKNTRGQMDSIGNQLRAANPPLAPRQNLTTAEELRCFYKYQNDQGSDVHPLNAKLRLPV